MKHAFGMLDYVVS